ncbi:MAG: cyanophycin synthetase [Acidobacteriota bacterium]
MSDSDPDFEGPEARQLTALLETAPTFGDGPGLHRTAELLDRLRIDPFLDRLDAVKITGSNGKGSTSAVLDALLRELGVRTALFTSPHLVSPAERIRIDGSPIGPASWRRAWRRIDELTSTQEQAGAFERLTAMAVERAAAADVETVVAEAGIGGRLDPTRAIPGRVVGLTSLDLEHSALLGDSLELIAYDKLDLCPDGGVVVLGSWRELHLPPTLFRRITGYLRVRGVEARPVDAEASLLDARYVDGRMVVEMEIWGERLGAVELAMAGRFQWSNAVVALLLADAWAERHRPDLDRRALLAAWRRVVARVALPGRFEKAAATPPVVIDFCHTPRAAQAVADLAKESFRGQPIMLVLGVSADKELTAVAGPLLKVADSAVITRASRRGASTEALRSVARKTLPDERLHIAEPVSAALHLARDWAQGRGGAVLVAGGLFLGVEARGGLSRAESTVAG